MTYEELYNLFLDKNSHLKDYIRDYRPGGRMKLRIWFDNRMMILVKYDDGKDVFELRHI